MPNFKVIVAGGREFTNYEFVREKLLFFLQNKLPNVTIISGGATGADALGEQFAKENNLELIVVPANWEKYGRAAGPRRNAEMAEMADALITEQRTILKPRLNLSKAILRKMRSPKSRFCRSYDFTKEQDIEEYIGWFRTIGLPIQNYIIKELEEQYGQELTLFREKVDEFNMTLTQPDAKKIN